jgi:hypothetical protein
MSSVERIEYRTDLREQSERLLVHYLGLLQNFLCWGPPADAIFRRPDAPKVRQWLDLL